MKLYPFQTIWLKTGSSREELSQLLLEQTFLSDQGFRRTDDRKKYFFGEINDQEFSLETINSTERLAPYIRGRILGVGHETYIRLQFGAFRHQRAYLLLSIFLLSCLVIILRGFALEGSYAMENIPFLIFGGVVVSVALFLLYQTYSFHHKAMNSRDFFRGLFQADIIHKSGVPGVFRL